MLVPIKAPDYPVLFDIAYATSRNFTGKPVYAWAKCYLHENAAAKLREVIRLASALNLKIKIFDAFRPSEAQWKLWHHTPDPDFLADPKKGSPHSRGCALDLTLCTPDGTELDMGTAFDAFTPLSYHGVTDGISAQAQANRLLLMGIMTSAGWDFYRNEWWHYQLFHARDYPVLTDEEAGTGMM